jgi:hypothetical protein
MKLFSKVLLNVAVRTTILLTTQATAQMPLAIAGGNGTPIATLHAEGAQVYECKPDPGKSLSEVSALTWQFREPIATLMGDGKSIGRHYAGPNWEHIDGSVVKGKVIASAPGATPSEFPRLELESSQRRHLLDCYNGAAHQHEGWSCARPCEKPIPSHANAGVIRAT